VIEKRDIDGRLATIVYMMAADFARDASRRRSRQDHLR
jgi:hypothetical protein